MVEPVSASKTPNQRPILSEEEAWRQRERRRERKRKREIDRERC